MKSSNIERAIGNIIREQENVATYIEGLDASEKRRVLMYVATSAAHNIDVKVMFEAVELLGFRDEEVLIFACALNSCGRKHGVPTLVKRFCKNTAVARMELGQAAHLCIVRSGDPRNADAHNAKEFECAIECIELMKQPVRKHVKGDRWDNCATGQAIRILKNINASLLESPCNEALKACKERLRKMMQTDEDWQWLETESSYNYSGHYNW